MGWTANNDLAVVVKGVPSRAVAVVATVVTTFAPYGRSALGRKMRTVSPSAHDAFPATALPFAVTLNAALVEARSIAAEKRTEIVASRPTLVVPSVGRKRTTVGAMAVWRSSVAGVDRDPVGVTDAVDDQSVVRVGAECRQRGEHELLHPVDAGADEDGSRDRRVDPDGVAHAADLDLAIERDRDRGVDRDPLPERDGGADDGGGGHPGQEARAGRRGQGPTGEGERPGLDGDRVVAATSHCVDGAIERAVPASFQWSRTAIGGSTWIADSTEARSIGVLNSIVAAASRSTPVATIVRNAAWVSGTISVGGVATVGAGRTSAMAPTATIAPIAIAAPPRASGERRSIDPT